MPSAISPLREITLPAAPPAAPRAPPLKNPANAASPNLKAASCAVNESSIEARLAMAIPSCTTSVVPSIAALLPAVVVISLARVENISPSFTARFAATFPNAFSIAASPSVPTAAIGAPTKKDLKAVSAPSS